MKIATHSGAFHADDGLGVAILLALFPDSEVIRTRDMAVIRECEFAVDVGGEWAPLRNRFDHHQKGFSERRQGSGIPYASAGLVWAQYGVQYVRSLLPDLSDNDAEQLAAEIDSNFLAHADAIDSGVSVPGPHDFGLSSLVSNFNPTWRDLDESADSRFLQAVAMLSQVLQNLVVSYGAERLAGRVVREATRLANGRILLLDKPKLPFERYVCLEMPHVLFVVYPESSGQQYQVRVVPARLGTFEARADLPLAWAGLRDADLAAVTGVADAVFCHNGRFICGAQSQAGALALARLALAEIDELQPA